MLLDVVTRRQLGLPSSWPIIFAWLICTRPVAAPGVSEVDPPVRNFPEVPVLPSYRGAVGSDFWKCFPKNKKAKFCPRIKVPVLARLIQKCWWDWDIHQRKDAKIALKILREGARTNLNKPLGPLRAKNAESAFENGVFLTDNIAKWVSQGVVAGPFKRKPLKNFRVNPLMAVPQKNKIRPILNLSAPRGQSFNDAVEMLKLKKLRMSSARLFSEEIAKKGKGAVFAKYDISDAYKLISGHASQWNCFGFKWLGRYFFDLTTVFGSKSAPANFDFLPETLVNIATTLSKVPKRAIFRQLDDVPVVGARDSKFAERFAAEYTRICRKIGVPLADLCPNREKAFGPGCTGTVLGVKFDSEKMSWSLNDEKRGKILRQIENFSKNRACTLKEAQTLHGQLNDLSLMLDFAKGFRFNLIRLLGKFETDQEGKRLITADLKQDLKIWSELAHAAAGGFPIPVPTGKPPITALRFVSDAAGAAYRWEKGSKINTTVPNDRGVASLGFDGENLIFAGGYKWPFALLTKSKDGSGTQMGFKSAMLETVGLLIPFLTRPDMVRGKHILLQVDNLAVIFAWSKKYCRNDAETSLLIRVLHVVEALLECKIYCEHLPRKSNSAAVLADHLSRESTTTKSELAAIKHVDWSPLKGALAKWLENPVMNWNLPQDICSELLPEINKA